MYLGIPDPDRRRFAGSTRGTGPDRGPAPIVHTAQGAVRGRWTSHGAEFRGIPYAEAPTGERRFAPPRRHASWGGRIRSAEHFGDAAPQAAPEPPFGTLLGTRASSEHCLSLNVWTPSTDPQARLPVMVWIHGGGYADESGSDEPFHGHSFARDGVVLVTINYRLGVLGYLEVEDAFGITAGSGNFGALDQICALEWVQENVAAFGGDADNVTVFGESAGGWAVATLLASHRARGLFRRAICQSGAGDHVLTSAQAAPITARYLELLGVRRGDVDALREIDVNRILAAQDALYAQALDDHGGAEALLGERADLLLCLMPVANGEVVDALPVELVRAGAGADVDLVIGSNTEEYGLYRMFPGGVFSAARMLELSRSALRSRGVAADEVEAHYRARYRDDFAVGEAMETDRFFRLPTLDLARAHATAGGRTYLYELAYGPTEFGACHVMDVPLVFDRLDTEMARTLVGGTVASAVAELVHGAWVSFARTGDPDPQRKLGWAAYRPDRPVNFVIDETCRVELERETLLRKRWGR